MQLFWTLLRNFLLRRWPAGKRGYQRTDWCVRCSWGDCADVEIQFDKAVHLSFFFTAEEAMAMAKRINKVAAEAIEFEKELQAYDAARANRAVQSPDGHGN
jgi:hypothetical protein